MRIIKPSVELVGGNIPYVDRPTHVELCGRVCYKSESRIADDSAERFIRSIIARGHEAVLEHARITLDLTACPDEFWLLRNWCDWMENNGQTPYITMSYTNKCIMSGNIRAWRNLCRCTGAVGTFENLAPGARDKLHKKLIRMWHENVPFFPEFIKKGDPDIEESFSDVNPRLFEDPELRKIHSWYTLRFICDRGISHEIVRHRPASYCQESTRYCNYSSGAFDAHITVVEPCFFEPDTLPYLHWKNACNAAEMAYFALLKDGCSPQEARDVLPTSLKTELVMTATAAEWLHFLRLRTSEAAHPQMREVAEQARQILIKQDTEVFINV